MRVQVLRSELASGAGSKQRIEELGEQLAAAAQAGRCVWLSLSAMLASSLRCLCIPLWQRRSAARSARPAALLSVRHCGCSARPAAIKLALDEPAVMRSACRERDERWRQQLEDQQATASSQAQVWGHLVSARSCRICIVTDTVCPAAAAVSLSTPQSLQYCHASPESC